MRCKPCLERGGCEANVDFFICGGDYFGFVDEVPGRASAGEGAIILLSAITGVLFAGGVVLGDFVVVSLHYGSHIVHATEADLDCVSVNDLVELVPFGEVRVDEP